MRRILIIASALVAAAPAAAQPSDSWDYEQAARQIDFDRAARVLDRMIGVVMNLPVGGIAAAVDPLGRGGIYPHDTIGSLARRSDPDVDQRIRANIGNAVRTAESASRAVARMMPALERSLDEMRRGIAEAIESAEDE
jgi:hypothetical protein